MTKTRVAFALLATFSACSDSGGTPTADGPTTPTADAGGLQGSWALTAQNINGTPTPQAELDGALVVTATDFAFASTQPGNLLTTYTVAGNGQSLSLSGASSVPFNLNQQGLTMTLPGNQSVTFSRDTSAAKDTFSVKGTVTAPTASPTFMHPKALLAFQTSNTGISPADPRIIQSLTFNGATATFDIELDQGALGDERVVFGAAGIVAGYLVIFDDRDNDGALDNLFAMCAAGSGDCVLGVSDIFLVSRDGASAQLDASPFAYIRQTNGSWVQATVATDARSGGGNKRGLVSMDASKTVPFDVTLFADPTLSKVNAFDLTVPAAK